MADLQSIVSSMEERNLINHGMLPAKVNATLKSIRICRTKESGMNKDVCDSCGDIRIHYNSCRNPNCPKCQSTERAAWVDRQKYYKLNISYFHIVFTMPDSLNSLCLHHPKLMYDLLFESVGETLNQLAADKEYLGARIGFTTVLHTWGQNLSLHPHLHCIVTSGGISQSGKWISSKKDFIFPVFVLSKLFRGKYLSKLKMRLSSEVLEEFKSSIEESYSKEWVVYVKPPLSNPDKVIEYLGRYTHRIAISDARIIKYEDNRVTFRYKDYKDHNKLKLMTLSEEEFLRRFIMHIPPKSFMRIRHFGLLSSSYKGKKFETIRKLTNTELKTTPYVKDVIRIINSIIKRDVRYCIHCNKLRHPLIE